MLYVHVCEVCRFWVWVHMCRCMYVCMCTCVESQNRHRIISFDGFLLYIFFGSDVHVGDPNFDLHVGRADALTTESSPQSVANISKLGVHTSHLSKSSKLTATKSASVRTMLCALKMGKRGQIFIIKELFQVEHCKQFTVHFLGCNWKSIAIPGNIWWAERSRASCGPDQWGNVHQLRQMLHDLQRLWLPGRNPTGIKVLHWGMALL